MLKLIQNEWVGSEADISSIAGILKKNYAYPLSRSTGLKPSLWSGLWDSIKSEGGKTLVEAGKWIIILGVLIIFLSYFPDMTERVRNFLSNEKHTEQNKNHTGTLSIEISPTPTPEHKLTEPTEMSEKPN